MIELFIVSFVAGVLTVLAPCILPILPVIIGGSSLQQNAKTLGSLKHPLIITGSLVVSIVISTLLLKATTVLLGVPSMVWAVLSGGIVLLFGLNLLAPSLWERLMAKTGLAPLASRLLGKTSSQTGVKKDIVLGAALGPVFNSCSPTYALIVAVLLPASFVTGLGYLIAYATGLGLMLLLIGIFGRLFVSKIKWLSDPRGLFQKIIGVVFVVVGTAVMLGLDKQIQVYVLEHGWYDPVMHIEQSLQLR